MGEIIHDLMLEVPGIYRSRGARLRLDHEVERGEILDLNGRRWEVIEIHPAHSLLIDRRFVARELVEEKAASPA